MSSSKDDIFVKVESRRHRVYKVFKRPRKLPTTERYAEYAAHVASDRAAARKRQREEEQERKEEERKFGKRSIPKTLKGKPILILSSGSDLDDSPSPTNEQQVEPAKGCWTLPTSQPPSAHDLDRLNYHMTLSDFGKKLQDAANAVFSKERRSKYTRVSVILLSWEDEDPRLPVSLEIQDVKEVFGDLYGFEVEEWQIPNDNGHMELNLKILQFLKDSSNKHLKIVYYAGHGKLSNYGQAIWTSHRNSREERPPTVKWSGIQNALEESPSDVLILLDCCASGLSNTDEGNGVTELLAACAFNNIANGVGPFSFTHALLRQLRKLAHMPSFTIGYLYNLIFADIQGLPIGDAQRKKPPVHLTLTQDHRLPRSVRISAKSQIPIEAPPSVTFSSSGCIAPDLTHLNSSFAPHDTLALYSLNTSIASQPSLFPCNKDGSSSVSSVSQLPEYPRLLFSIRINENIKPKDLSPELFADWLGTLPLSAKSVKVEAGFASDSTILVVSIPVALLSYLPEDPAITMLGITRSTNLMSLGENIPPGLGNYQLRFAESDSFPEISIDSNMVGSTYEVTDSKGHRQFPEHKDSTLEVPKPFQREGSEKGNYSVHHAGSTFGLPSVEHIPTYIYQENSGRDAETKHEGLLPKIKQELPDPPQYQDDRTSEEKTKNKTPKTEKVGKDDIDVLQLCSNPLARVTSKEVPKTFESNTGKYVAFRNVSPCNRCLAAQFLCDHSLPRCAPCQRADANCVGFDLVTKREIPRSYVFFLEAQILYLQKLMEKHEIPLGLQEPTAYWYQHYQPAELRISSQTKNSESFKSPPSSGQYLRTFDINTSPLTPPTSAIPDSSTSDYQ